MWMMRQAGRYLPEYRQLRQDKGSFLDLVYDSEAAAEVTLQPLRRFPELDAAILFSDILIVPFTLGQNLTFVTSEGPRLTPPLFTGAIDQLTPYSARQARGLCARDRSQRGGPRRNGRSALGCGRAAGRPAAAGQPRSAGASCRRRGAEEWSRAHP